MKEKENAQSFCINICSKLWVVLLYMDLLHPPLGAQKVATIHDGDGLILCEQAGYDLWLY
jgi:hypothetical protein